MEIRENVTLAPLTTIGIGGPARWFVEAKQEQDVPEALAWAEQRELPVFVLGGGSNLLVRDEGYNGLVLHMAMEGCERSDCTRFVAEAGMSWDAFVDTALNADCSGVECLAGIPGTVGGTPVQNVGAYGQDVAMTIAEVRAWDRKQERFRWLSNAECGFAYRRSIFNTTEVGRYVVTAVAFALRQEAPTLAYAELAERLRGKNPSLREVAATVRNLRQAKGMLIDIHDWDSRSAGSFFKNPIVGSHTLQQVADAVGITERDVPKWPAGPEIWKLPAAWLLEKAGFVKGYGEGRVGISTKHTLALVNRGGATFADLMRFQAEVVAGVEAKFGIKLEREPVVLG